MDPVVKPTVGKKMCVHVHVVYLTTCASFPLEGPLSKLKSLCCEKGKLGAFFVAFITCIHYFSFLSMKGINEQLSAS